MPLLRVSHSVSLSGRTSRTAPGSRHWSLDIPQRCRPPQDRLTLVLLPTPKLNHALACCSDATTAARAARVASANLLIVLVLSDVLMPFLRSASHRESVLWLNSRRIP